MARLIVVVGLPGSGKTYYVRQKLQPVCSGICAQDFMANSHGSSPRFTDSRYYRDLIRHLRGGADCAIADIEYCDTWRRVEVEEVIRRDAPGTIIDWRFFANDPERCARNV